MTLFGSKQRSGKIYRFCIPETSVSEFCMYLQEPCSGFVNNSIKRNLILYYLQSPSVSARSAPQNCDSWALHFFNDVWESARVIPVLYTAYWCQLYIANYVSSDSILRFVVSRIINGCCIIMALFLTGYGG